mgnify:FL=1
MRNLDAWRALRAPFLTGLALSAALLLLPLTALGEPPAGADAPPSAGLLTLPAAPTPVPASAPPPGEWDASQTLNLLGRDGQVSQTTMGDYLWGVVAAEMPASFEPEALRAQAVCARTYSLWKLRAKSHEEDGADICADSTCCQAYLSKEDAAQRWGEGTASAYTAKIAAAVADTDGQVLTYEGGPIQAVFFSSASGATEDAAAVWGKALPYLVSVDSPEGEEVPNYRSTVTLTAEQVKKMAAEAGLDCDLSGEPSGWFQNHTRTASGRVASVDLGGIALSGGAARSLFALRSACFDVKEQEGVFTFSVTGYGHGVGMSQYGANAMAREGAGWRDILTHYYTGAQLQTGL